MSNAELKEVKVDLPERQEIRLALPCCKADEVLLLLANDGFEELSFSDRKMVRTIYFNNPEHEVPWGISLKARQYVSEELTEGSFIDNSDEYLLEIKTSEAGFKEKKRLEMSLSDATTFLNIDQRLKKYILSSPVKPHLIDEYIRLHFVPKEGSDSGLRITCDYSPKYYLINANGKLVFLRQENVVRVEIKTKEESSLAKKVISDLEEIGGRRVISKKQTAYWSESMLNKKNAFHLTKEFSETEIESKLLVIDPDPSLFFNKFTLFMRKPHGRFVISPNYQNVEESGSMNSYYVDKDLPNLVDGIKVLARPDVAKVILKSETEVLPDKYNFGSILKRREIKRRYFPLEEGNLDKAIQSERIEGGASESLILVGQLERLRKGIWLSNLETGRCYHVTMDQCEVGIDKFHEIEIEYTGTSGLPQKDPIEEVTNDITDLTKLLIDEFSGSVEPCRLTKFSWLSNRS